MELVHLSGTEFRQRWNIRSGDKSERVDDCPVDMYTESRHNILMIRSIADKETEKVYNQVFSKKLPHDIQRIALRKLIMLDNARTLEDLKVPPANRLEKLHGDREGQYSIRINDQFRICFNFASGDASNMEITDYH